MDVADRLERRDRDQRLLGHLRGPQLGDRIHRFVGNREQHRPEIELRVLGADGRRGGPEVIEDRIADDDEVSVGLVEDVGNPTLTRGVRGPHDVRIGVQREGDRAQVAPDSGQHAGKHSVRERRRTAGLLG